MKDETVSQFEGLDWHDAVLLEIRISRRKPGELDHVVFLVEWVDQRRRLVRFFDCYALEAKMNFGVIAEESFRTAHCYEESPEVDELKGRWSKSGVHISVFCFEFETNSTGSRIKIFSRGVEILDE